MIQWFLSLFFCRVNRDKRVRAASSQMNLKKKYTRRHREENYRNHLIIIG